MLDAESVERTAWTELAPSGPNYYFVPEDGALREEYERGWKVTEAMPVNVLGFQTHRDEFATDIDLDAIRNRMLDMRGSDLTDAELAERYALTEIPGRKLSGARNAMREDSTWQDKLVRVAYRPFDDRWAYFNSVVMDRPRRELVDNVVGKPNLCLVIARQALDGVFKHVVVTSLAAEGNLLQSAKGGNSFPLWLYPRSSNDLLDTAPKERTPNLAPAFIAALAQAVGTTPTPEDTLAYLYAILYAPSYRVRYADFLKRDFPRVPLTTNRKLFATLVGIGRELIALHTMQTTLPRITGYPVAGSNEVVKVRFTASQSSPSAQPAPASGSGGNSLGRVWINDAQYFDGVPVTVWDMHIGGYQVAEKWLKDRKGRLLSFDDIEHYQRVIAALARTLDLQTALDAAIAAAGGWPLV